MKTKPINIFVDCHVLDGSYQGTTTYIKGLYSEAIKDKRFNFYFAANDINRLQQTFGESVNVYYIKYPVINKYFRLLFAIPYLIKKYNIDYAHFQYIVPPIKLCKYINTIHDILFMDYPEFFPESYKLRNKFLFSWSAKKSDIVATVSSYSSARLSHHFSIDSIITPNAVNPDYYESYDKKTILNQVKVTYGFDKYWLYVSRWEPRKNHHSLLRCFTENKYYKNYHLVLAGYNDITNHWFNEVYSKLSAEIKSKIVILGSVTASELMLLTRGASLSIYPSLAEGFGIPPLESAAAGIPTACSNTTAMSDFTFFGDTLFDPNSGSEMQNAIEAALNNVNITDIQHIISEKYRWDLSASILLEAIVENSCNAV